MTQATTLYLVRHGETAWNASERCQGSLDIPMNDNGVRQARLAGNALRHIVFDAAYTSGLGRAQQTAAAILDGSALTAVPIADLSELSYGDWHGLRPDEWPNDTAARWRRDPWSVAFPGGESLTVLRNRVIPAFRRIAANHAGQRILIASHGHVNRVMLIHAMGTDPATFWEIEQANGAVIELTLVDVDARGEGATWRYVFPQPQTNTTAK
ncbi:MAG: histidine phosphatase family protein [Gemmatimonadaceae bacterium]